MSTAYLSTYTSKSYSFFSEKLNNDIVIHQDHEYPVIGHDNFLVSRISSCQRPVALAHALVALPS